MRQSFWIVALTVLVPALWIVVVPETAAYEQYHPGDDTETGDGCYQCHGWNNDANPVAGTDDTSPFRNGGFDGRQELHDLHQDQITGTCGLCHISPGDVGFTATSGDAAGQGCRGCHGVDPNPQGPDNFEWGAGLRLHHANAGAPADLDGDFCVDCHDSDPLPPPEDSVPVYYLRADVNAKDPCNADGTEDWGSAGAPTTPDGQGLDNDGDLDYDGDDSDCDTGCTTNADCNDDEVCTDDICDDQTGLCSNPPNTLACDDGLFCNGADSCSGGTCSDHAGDPCAGPDGDADCSESCDEGADSCTAADPDGSACPDGLFCNGAETCTSGTCQSGTPPSVDDGVGCTDDSCDEENDVIVNTPNDANCPDDTLFCNGTEFCDPALDCSSTGDPCPGGTVCNESTDICEAAPQQLLTVNKLGQGDGTVTSDPAGIDCGSICQWNFALDSDVGLTAARGANSTFDGWGEDCSGTTLGTTVTMSSDKTCTATFESCVSVKDVSGKTISDEQYFEACTTLFAGAFQVLGPGGVVTLFAGLEVVLGNGFEVLTDGTLVIGSDAALLP
jgi:hypothetical protein